MKSNPFRAYSGLPSEMYLLFAARLVTAMGSFIMPLLTLILTRKLGFSPARAGGWLTLLTVSQAPCLALGGRLADTMGRKKLLLFSQTAAAAAYLLCAAAGGKSMVPCILLAADLSVLGYPASDALVADLAAPAQRKAAYSLLYFGTNVGITFSMLLGGLLFERHLPLLFALDALTTLACCAIVALGVKEHYRRPEKEADGPAAPPLWPVLRAAPVLIVFLLLMFLFDFCYAEWNFLLPAQMGAQFAAEGARLFSLLVAVNGAVVILCTPFATARTERLHPLAGLAAGGALYTAAYLVFAAGSGMPLYLAASVLFTLGEVLSTIQIGTFIADHTPAPCRGRMTALGNFVRGAGSASSPAVTGALLPGTGYRGAWLLTAVLMALGTAGMALLRRADRRAAPGTEEKPKTER